MRKPLLWLEAPGRVGLSVRRILSLTLAMVALLWFGLVGCLGVVAPSSIPMARAVSCDPLTVTSTTDNINSCGTLRYALNYLSTNPSSTVKTVSFALTSTPATITVSGSGFVVPAGTNLNAPCGPSGPGLTLSASGVITGPGLTLTTSTIITGVRVVGFSSPQISVTHGGGNRLVCTVADAAHPAPPFNLVRLSSDPYTNTYSQHQTEVEPDSFAYGSTIVAAQQVGRITNGGGANIGWETSTDGGNTWTNGFLPGITKNEGGGPNDAVSDVSVAYDARHATWLASTLPIIRTPQVSSSGVVVSRSPDGLTWSKPITVANGDLDKNWVVCDNTSSSPYYGHCYTEWDDANGIINMSTSTDGGLTWGAPLRTADQAGGIGGQPLVQPGGRVIVPINDSFQGAILSFVSNDGGASWSSTLTVANINAAFDPGNLRSSPLPSAEIDANGKVYVVWEDCSFRANCSSNDLVMSTSTDGTSWTAPVRIPLDPVTSTVDHFIPGLAVDPTTSGATAHLAMAYYYYPNVNCTAATCQLEVGLTSSVDGGASWSKPVQLAGPMQLSWIANTTQGPMVGDYISTSFVNGKAFPVFVVGKAPTVAAFDEATYTIAPGLSPSALVAGGTVPVGSERPVASAKPRRSTGLRPTWR